MDPSVIQTVHHTIDWTIVATAVGSVIAILGINISIFAWLRSDMKLFETEIRAWRQEINNEMKDFHGRLCAIEEKRKQGR
jgi:hypothetical protein